ncbi:helix-turn-helix transcriptional regulator [Streptomyces viridiviolaceus]|uniref:LuxR C-terminal-related transcriptional regulator n=1 Tax=Streptomyces viridiviolaceus TaxID=68282 RepID=A0ABW2EBW0_9ACTN|nr:response regulator transcription factor [Streptomyces viridiviolaceus]GHB68423.1 helix-turn-helix transcriptional regulator [Streptomyces viridiviolaceus]
MPDHTAGPARVADPAPAVVVEADDPLVLDGTTAFMRSGGRVRVLPRERTAEADVAVVITGDTTPRTLAVLHRVSKETGGRARIVLVADCITEAQVRQAVTYGMTGFLVRPRSSFSHIVNAAVDSARGEPAPLTTGPPGPGESPDPVPLALREAEVLRLLAEGKDVIEIAGELCYSERLIKSVIHTVVKRFGVRNRTHAVAYAIRMGIL